MTDRSEGDSLHTAEFDLDREPYLHINSGWLDNFASMFGEVGEMTAPRLEIQTDNGAVVIEPADETLHITIRHEEDDDE